MSFPGHRVSSCTPYADGHAGAGPFVSATRTAPRNSSLRAGSTASPFPDRRVPVNARRSLNAIAARDGRLNIIQNRIVPAITLSALREDDAMHMADFHEGVIGRLQTSEVRNDLANQQKTNSTGLLSVALHNSLRPVSAWVRDLFGEVAGCTPSRLRPAFSL